MKRFIIILSVFCILLLAVSIFIKPVIIILTKKQLRNVFIQSRVAVGGCVLRPLRGVSLLDIEIKKQGVYDIKIKEAAVRYNLLKAGPLKLFLKDTGIYLNTPKKEIREFAGSLNLGRGSPPIFGSLDVSKLTLDLNTLDLTAKATLSLGLNLLTQNLDYLDFKMDIFKMPGVQTENVFLKLYPNSAAGNFSIAQMKYDKLRVTDIKGNLKLEDMILSLYGVSARTLDGDLRADMDLKINKQAQYTLNLKCADLDIERFVRDFNLREKFDMSGRLSGDLKLQGKGAHIEILGGNFSTLEPGGTLVIRDTKFLENMARKSRQPLDLLGESFKDFRYNTGVMSLSFEEGNIILKIELEGEAGKRNLKVVLHNFSLGKEEQ